MNDLDLNNYARLVCTKEGTKLRVRIISNGYSNEANCQFPRDIRAEGQEYLVPREDISLSSMRGKFFYRVKKNRIKIVDKKQPDFTNFKVYDQGTEECIICMDEDQEIIILAPCGHTNICNVCIKQISKCPLCRSNIEHVVTKDQLQR